MARRKGLGPNDAREVVHRWTDDYAHEMSDAGRKALAAYADDIASAMLNAAEDAFDDGVMHDLQKGLVNFAEAKRNFVGQLAEVYGEIVDGARDAKKR